MSLTDIESWWGTTDKLTLFGTAATFAAVLVAIWQLRDANKTAVGQFWLTLRGVITEYDDIHANFRPRGRWHGSTTLPNQVNDWARTELYMGLLEYCNTLMDQDLLDRKHFRDWYAYRIRNLLSNPRVITYKLHDNAEGWKEFHALCKRLRIKIPEPAMGLAPFISEDRSASEADPKIG
jgi:hypothetical protein